MADSPDPAGSPAPGSCRVLVVDDEPGVRTVLGRALARWDYEVFLAECGPDALVQLAREPAVDVLVSDVTMPVMTGLELAAEVRARYPELPILFVTATPVPPDLLDDRLIDVVHKPVRITEVRAHLQALLDRGRRPGDRTSADALPADGNSADRSSADPVQPAHGDTLTRLAEGFELVVPGLPEQQL